ncbi:AAA family ATPase [Nocardia sp. NPDC005978]|uniref:helix-turn-helix transcriptional regulator n=1 Tax=Nocardia sp. NPDC005978 TaxID=3156725 RepID=UPI0033B01B6E
MPPAEHDSPGTSSFIGRDQELRRIALLLDNSKIRLLTLVGPGGIGKTRLAGEAIRRRPTPLSSAWVNLARLPRGADADVVAEEVARIVALAGLSGRSPWDAISSALANDPGDDRVLVLDNCEHLIDAAHTFISELRRRLPNVTVLATSRQSIGCRGERTIVVEPLPHQHARSLFCHRAQLTGFHLEPTQTQLSLVDQVCRRVDRNPLFIRLAAARLRYRTLSHVLRELTGDDSDRRLGWSAGARADPADRHNNIADAIAWSYELCGPLEKRLLENLSVFAAGSEAVDGYNHDKGVELDAVVAVCAGSTLPADSIVELLQRLVDRSLVSVDTSGPINRYYMLESIRLYARERLEQRQPALVTVRALRARHRRYYRDRIIVGHATWFGRDEQRWLEWMRSSWNNILMSLETGIDDPADALVTLESLAALMSLRIPFVTGANRTITALTEAALGVAAAGGGLPLALRIDATASVAWVAVWQGRSAYTARLLDQCVAACPTLTVAHHDWRASADIDVGLPAPVEFTFALELMTMKLDARAIPAFTRARTKFAAIGDSAGAARSELFEVLSTCVVGEPHAALTIARHHLDRTLRAGAIWAHWWAKLAWILAQSRHGDPARAAEYALDTLPDIVAANDRWTASWLIHYYMMALTYSIADHPRSVAATSTALRIARIHSGLARLHRLMGIAPERTALVASEIRQAIDIATATLGPHTFAGAAAQGAAFKPENDELQRYVLGFVELPDPVSPQHRQIALRRWNLLSRTETEVALLIAEGWTNSAIAAHRGKSLRTIDAQVLAIRRKLSIANREDINRFIPPSPATRIDEQPTSEASGPS